MKASLLAEEYVPAVKEELGSIHLEGNDFWPLYGFFNYRRRLNNVKKKLPNPIRIELNQEELEEKVGGLFKRVFRKGKSGWPENKELFWELERFGGRNALMVGYHSLMAYAIGLGLSEMGQRIYEIIK